MALMDLIKARHSIRKYTDEQIRREDLDTILEAGNYVSKEQPSTIDAPSIKNGFYDAPTVVCVFCQDNFLFKTADAFCMMENMILQATEQAEKAGKNQGSGIIRRKRDAVIL